MAEAAPVPPQPAVDDAIDGYVRRACATEDEAERAAFSRWHAAAASHVEAWRRVQALGDGFTLGRGQMAPALQAAVLDAAIDSIRGGDEADIKTRRDHESLPRARDLSSADTGGGRMGQATACRCNCVGRSDATPVRDDRGRRGRRRRSSVGDSWRRSWQVFAVRLASIRNPVETVRRLDGTGESNFRGAVT